MIFLRQRKGIKRPPDPARTATRQRRGQPWLGFCDDAHRQRLLRPGRFGVGVHHLHRPHRHPGALTAALGISLAQLAGQVSHDLDLSGAWWCAWQTWKDGVERVDTHTLEVHQRGELLQLDAERAIPVAEGSYRWRGELRLWDNEALIGWYRSTDGTVRSKGAMYLALHAHGTHAWGRWVGMSYDGVVITGWGSMARTQEQAHQLVNDLIKGETP